MTSTDITTVEAGRYTALARSPSELREMIAENLGSDEIGEFDLPRVSIPAGGATNWSVPGAFGEESTRELSGVLVYSKRTRAYWSNPDPTGEPPQCRSLDARIGVGNPGGDCKACPLSQFGSHPKGGQAQACSEKAIWFLLREGSILPLVLALPAMSLKGEKNYRIGLVSSGVKLTDVVTTLTVRPEMGPSGKYGIAVPTATARLEPEDASRAREYAEMLRPTLERAAAAASAEQGAGGRYVPDADAEMAA